MRNGPTRASHSHASVRDHGHWPEGCKSDDRRRLFRALVVTLVVSFTLFVGLLIHIWHELGSETDLPRPLARLSPARSPTASLLLDDLRPLGSYQSLREMKPTVAQETLEGGLFGFGLPGELPVRQEDPSVKPRKQLLDPAAVEAQLHRALSEMRNRGHTTPPQATTVVVPAPRTTAPALRVPPTRLIESPFHILWLQGGKCSSTDHEASFELTANVTAFALELSGSEERDVDTHARASATSIDFVVTYVNPFAISFAEGDTKVNPQRVRDWNELYWNLRSMFYNGRLCVVKGQPDRCLLGRIHLVVASRAHVPTWLSRRLVGPDANGTGKLELRFREFLRERLNVVEHKDMFPPGTPYSEAYNSNVIELNLHRIPGLSPFYLYFNNDMFLGRELRLQDLFTPIASPAQSMHCDLLPITWYEPDPTFRRPYAESPFASPFISQQHDVIEQMLHHTVEVLKTTSHLRWRSSLSPANDLPLLQYAHVPMLYDRALISRILDDREVRPALRETLGHPVARQPHDIWVPLLYINVRFVAVYDGSDATQSRVFRVARGNMYEFSMLTGTGALHSNYVRLGRYNEAAPAPLFVTLNDDFPASLPATAADPSTLLLGGEELPCESAFVDNEARIVEKGIGRDLVNRDDWVRAVRNLFHMHELYCGWEKIWAGNKV